MQIIIGYAYDYTGKKLLGTITFNPDYVLPEVSFSKLDGVTNNIEYIAMLDGDKAFRENAGWHEESHHPETGEIDTPWGRLIAHTESKDGHQELKKLKLRR